MGAAELSFVVKAIDEASGTLDHVDGKMGRMGGALGKLGGLAGGALVGGIGLAVGAVGGLTAVLGSSVKEAMAAEEIQAQLEAVLKSTGGVAGVTADAINDHAQALSEVTRFEDDAIVGADNILLTFTNIGKDVFPTATESVLDMATAFGMDLNSAAMMVGKALNDPEKGLTALSKAGVQFTEDQKAMIKKMVEVGDTAGAQKLILGELEKQVGGSAEAAGKTAAGQMDIFKNAIGNVKEEIGGALLPILTDMAIKFGPSLLEGAKKFADWAVTSLIPALQKVGVWLETNIPIAVNALKKAWDDALPFRTAMARFFGDVWEVIKKVANWLSVNVPIAIDTLKKKWLEAQPTVNKIKGVFDDIGTALGAVWSWLQEKIPGAIAIAKGAFDGIRSTIDTILTIINNIISGAQSAIEWLKKIPGSMGGGTNPTGGVGDPGMGGNPWQSNARGSNNARGMSAPQIVVNINGVTGNPRMIAAAVENGVLAASRSLGYR